MIDNPLRRIPFERYRDDLYFMARRTQGISQSFRMDLSPSANEWDVNGGD
jgi:hypothetical protein